MSYDIEFIRQKHTEWLSHRVRWQFLYDSWRGGRNYAEGGYLTRYVYETEAEYASRLAQTPMDNHCSSIVSIYTSFIYSQTPRRVFNGIEDDPLFREFMEDSDLDGRDWDSFMRDVAAVTSVFGSAWIIIDKPDLELTTRADEIAQGVRPYANLYMPLAVLDWQYRRQPNGRYELDFLKVLLNNNGKTEEYALYYPDRIDVVEADIQGNEFRIVSSTANPLGYIPAVCAYSQRDNIRGIGVSDIESIADMQRAIYDELSEIEQLIRISNHPSLVSTSSVQASAGAGSRIIIEDNMDGALKPYLLQPSGASLDGIRNTIQDKIASINGMANLSSVRSTTGSSMSGVARDTEYRLLSSHLTQKADNLELAEEQIWAIVLQWMGYDNPEYDIDYPESFSTRDKLTDLTLIEKAKSILSAPAVGNRVIDHELVEQILNIVIDDESALAEIKRELETQAQRQEPAVPGPEEE